MPNNQSNNTRLAKNTLLLYGRMFITMLISLYTSRVVLRALGIEDYGIYNVVGGVVSMFSMLSSSMIVSTQRFISYELGRSEGNKLNKIFCTSINIHALISAIIVILLETIGLWFLYYKLVIPAERISCAFWVFQISIVTTIISFTSFPYNAIIIAHERMSIFALMSILETVLKLGIAISLSYINNYDILLVYSIMIASVQLLMRFLYSQYCSRNFKEASYHFIFDKTLFKDMLGFAGWNMFASSTTVLSNQGTNILLNMFFGPVVNAARGIAVQVQNTLTQFSSSFQTALNPQIVKLYAANEEDKMKTLVLKSCKFTYILLLIISIPILIETKFILHIWLGDVPEYTVIFVRIMIVTIIIEMIARPLTMAVEATKKIRNYKIITSCIMLMVLPFSYVALKLGMDAHLVLLIQLVLSIITYIVRLQQTKKLIKISYSSFINNVLIPCVRVSIPSIIIPIILRLNLHCTTYTTIIIILLSLIISIVSSYYAGLNQNERYFVFCKVKNYAHKLF